MPRLLKSPPKPLRLLTKWLKLILFKLPAFNKLLAIEAKDGGGLEPRDPNCVGSVGKDNFSSNNGEGVNEGDLCCAPASNNESGELTGEFDEMELDLESFLILLGTSSS